MGLVSIVRDPANMSSLVTLRVDEYAMRPGAHQGPMLDEIVRHALWTPYTTESHARRGRTMENTRR